MSTEPSSLVSTDTLAAAAERRASQISLQSTAAQNLAQHERRQVFRRLIDPGIIRPNSKEQASASLKTLLAIAENLLREPDNPKFQQFKPTNSIIKKNLVDPKGALEYAIELGFRPEVKNFQPYYTFNSRRIDELNVGTAILREFVILEKEREERAARSQVDQKAVAAAVANQVKLAFMDDRKTKMLQDDMERERLAARATATANNQVSSLEVTPVVLDSTPHSSVTRIPGSGHRLTNDESLPDS